MGTELTVTVEADNVRSLQLDDRGRVTIPKELREKFDAKSGDRLEVILTGDTIRANSDYTDT